MFGWLDKLIKKKKAPNTGAAAQAAAQTPEPEQEVHTDAQGRNYTNSPVGPVYQEGQIRLGPAPEAPEQQEAPASAAQAVRTPEQAQEEYMAQPWVQRRRKMFLGKRKKMFVGGLIAFVFLSSWTMSAFMTHIKEITEGETSWWTAASYGGALFGEVVLFLLLWDYCFDKSLAVRREALWYSLLLVVVIAGHAGVLRGMHSIEKRQTRDDNMLKDGLAQMSAQQMGAVNGAADSELNPRTRRAANAEAASAKAQIAEKAQAQYAEQMKTRDDKILDKTLAPKWYINGFMYMAIAIAAFAALARIHWLHINADPEDIDEDFDGIPDYTQWGPGRPRGRMRPATATP